jgi:hypothetical protein
MDRNREEEVRRRAQQIWENEGRPDGKDAQHWAQAERELEVAGKSGNATGFAEGSASERTAEDLKSGKDSHRH